MARLAMAKIRISKLALLARLRTLKKELVKAATHIGETSPEEALKSFREILNDASPRINFGIAFFTAWSLLLTGAFAKYSWLSLWLNGLKRYAWKWLYASVSIPPSHPLQAQILAYMVERGLGKNAKTLALTTPQLASKYSAASREYMMDMYYDPSGRYRNGKPNTNREDEERERETLSYVLDCGQYHFWHNWHRMTFDKRQKMQDQLCADGKMRLGPAPTGSETITISCLSPFAGAKPIQDFLNHIKAAPVKDRTTTIYRPDANHMTWDQGITRPSRTLNAVTLDSKVKDDLVKDIETYLSPATRKYYANRGIPYRRGLLFYGLPGCGKTSFANACAGHFNLNVYMLTLSHESLTDRILELLFEALPSRCIVLLEDIDSAGIKRENMRKRKRKVRVPRVRAGQQCYDADGNPMQDEHEMDMAGGGVTLSGLLNVLDGIHSKEGMLTIMTSNAPDSLDPALVRPGRIDRKVLFGYASKEVITKLYTHIFSKSPDEIVEGDISARHTRDIPALAAKFASRVPANQLTPAEVQGYLLLHREDPIAAVEEASSWAEKLLETKAAGTNVEKFADEAKDGSEDGNRRDSKVDAATETAGLDYLPSERETDADVDHDSDESCDSLTSSSSNSSEDESELSTPPDELLVVGEKGGANAAQDITAHLQNSFRGGNLKDSEDKVHDDVLMPIPSAGDMYVLPLTPPLSLGSSHEAIKHTKHTSSGHKDQQPRTVDAVSVAKQAYQGDSGGRSV